MEITLSDGQVIEILAINFSGKTVDWKRKEGYTGACVSAIEITDLAKVEDTVKAGLEAELTEG